MRLMALLRAATSKHAERWASWISVLALLAVVGAMWADAGYTIQVTTLVVAALAFVIDVLFFLGELNRST
jgi:hypothetical protein